MLLIVAHHYVVNSGLTEVDGPIYADIISWRSQFLLIFGAFGKTGINCFVLLTGYESFSLYRMIEVILPVRGISTGFTSCYLIFFLFIPFINILIKNMSEKQHITLVGLCLFTYVLIGTIPKFGIDMNYVSWFMIIYIIGAYIRLYPKHIFNDVKIWTWITLAVLGLSMASIVVMSWISALVNRSGVQYWFLSDSNKILAVALAVRSFLLFKNLKIQNSKFINTVAASTFGVLMIHANSDTMRQWLWQDILNNVEMYHSNWLILHAVGSVLGIYIICTILDYVRIILLEKPLFEFLEKKWFKK